MKDGTESLYQDVLCTFYLSMLQGTINQLNISEMIFFFFGVLSIWNEIFK